MGYLRDQYYDLYYFLYNYINYLEDDISSKVLKFVDDTKVFIKVKNDTDKHSLQVRLGRYGHEYVLQT